MKKFIFIFIITSVLTLSSCASEEQSTAETTGVSSVPQISTVSETFTENTSETAAETSEIVSETVTAAAEKKIFDGYIIYWEENGEEKSQLCDSFVSPYAVISSVLGKYYGEDVKTGIYDADWVVIEDATDISSEDIGVYRQVKYHAVLDLSEGYTAFVEEIGVEKVTNSIAKSLMETYDLSSIIITELNRDIMFVEDNTTE